MSNSNNETIQKQQEVATQILQLAHKAGLAVIVWTAEDTKEAIEGAAARAGITLADEEAFALAEQLLDENNDYIEEACIERGWSAILDVADDILREGK